MRLHLRPFPLLAGISAALLAFAPAHAASGDAPGSAEAALASGQILIQQAREGSDASLFERAEAAFVTALDDDATGADARVGLGVIALSRHRFGEALELGRAAMELDQGNVGALGVTFDALIELGHYDEAGEIIAAMVRARPDLTSFTRLSYHHELHGRIDEAIAAMERAVIAGGSAIEHTEYARVLLGDLWLLQGDRARARHLYRTALEAMPGYVPATIGLARVAIAEGDLSTAATLLERADAAQPEPATLLALGQVLEAQGDRTRAADAFAAAIEGEAVHRATGEPPEPFGALMEADHGDQELAVELARTAHQHAASIGAADALAWSLFRAGEIEAAQHLAHEALRTGSVDPLIGYHAGVILAAGGDTQRARTLLVDSAERAAAGPAGLPAKVEKALAGIEAP